MRPTGRGPGMPPGSPGLPHGPVQQQPKSKIDPDNMPNPVSDITVAAKKKKVMEIS